jgi:phospholipid transport system substrate-binding protein
MNEWKSFIVLSYREKEYLKMDKLSRNGFWLIMLCSCLFFLVVFRPAGADNNDPNDPNNPKDPGELLKYKWEAVVSVLQNKDIVQEAKEKKISKIVTPIFEFPLMAKLSLGRKHWPKLDASQREKFTQLFSERLKRSYWKKIALYKDETLLFKPTEKKKSTYLVPTELKYKDKKVAILYKFRKVDKSWKIYDVEIQGVSVLLTYRSQFDEILSHGTVKELLSRLEEPPDD